MSDSVANVQNGVHSQLTAATINSGVRAPAQVKADTENAILSSQPNQAPTQPKGAASEIAKWENYYSQEAGKQAEGKALVYYIAEAKRLKEQLKTLFTMKKDKMSKEQQAQKKEGDFKLAALRNLRDAFNKMREKENAKNNTSKKDKNRQFQIDRIMKLLERKDLSKTKRKQLTAELSKWTMYSNDNPLGLPTQPDDRETAHKTQVIKTPTVTIERPGAKSVGTNQKPSNPEYRQPKSKVGKSEQKSDNKPVAQDKPKNPSSKKDSPNKQQPKENKEKKANTNRVFREWKTQEKKFWRFNILDESVRRWLYALYSKRSGVSGRLTEPCLLAKIIKEDCHDIGYDKYVQSIMPYSGVTKDWLEKVLTNQNFESWSTITFADLLTELVIQALFLVSHDVPDVTTDEPAWYGRALDDEKFIMSPSINTIFLGNLLTPTKSNESILSQNPAAVKYCLLPIKVAISDLYTAAQRNLFEFAFKRFLEDCEHSDVDMLQYCNKSPAELIGASVDYYSLMEMELEEKKSVCASKAPQAPNDDASSSDDESAEEDNGDEAPPEAHVEEPKEMKQDNNFSLVASLADTSVPFQMSSLSRFTLFKDKLIETSFANEDVVVRVDIMPVALEDDVATKTRRSDENRCLFLKPTWSDGHPDTNTYAINLAHFYSIAGRLSASSDSVQDAIKVALSSYSDTPYILPHAARLTLNSPQMVIMLNCIFRPCLNLAIPTYPSSRAREVCPTSDPIMRIKFHREFKKVLAIQIIPDATESLRFITPNVENVSLAVGKRFNNAFNYVAFVWAFEGFQDFLVHFWDINPFKVVFDDNRLFDYVQSMRIRKNLTVNQFFNLLEKCVEISDLLAEDPEKVVRLLHYELWNNTKVFIKKELYSKETTPRFIISPSPYVKLIYGCLIHQMENVFYHEDSPMSHFFIKHKKEDEIAMELTLFNDDCPPGYVFVANDFTSFEGSQPRPAQSIIFSLFFSFTYPNSLERSILNVVYDALCSYVNVYSDNFSILKCPGQMSGLPHTSCGNGGLNVLNGLEAMGISPDDMKAEGDDSVIRVEETSATELSHRSIFPCEPTISHSMFDLSFCGRRLNLDGNIFVHLEEEADEYVQFNTVLSSHSLSDQDLYDIGYMRLLSLSFRYPANPLVERCRIRFNDRFANSGLQLSKKGVSAYARSNWYEMLMNPLDVQDWIRERFQYPREVPQLTQSDVVHIRTSSTPALDLSETLNYRVAHKPDETLPWYQMCVNYVISLLIFVACRGVSYLRVFALVTLILLNSSYLFWLRMQRKYRTNNPIKYFWRCSTETIPIAIKKWFQLENANPDHLKLSHVKSLPRESRMYGLNILPSNDLIDEDKDPDLGKFDCDREGYISRLNALAATSRGQPVRVTSEQLKLLESEYHTPDHSWLQWNTEADVIPYEVTKHAYSQFYPERIRKRLTSLFEYNALKAQQANEKAGSDQIYSCQVARGVNLAFRLFRFISTVRNHLTHRNEQH